MRILFLHGWTSVPGGRKPTYLKDHGYEVIDTHAGARISRVFVHLEGGNAAFLELPENFQPSALCVGGFC